MLFWDKYLHLFCSALCVLLWFPYSAGLPQSLHSGPSLSFVWACWMRSLLSGVQDGDEGLEPLLVSAPFCRSFSLSLSLPLFFLYNSILFLSLMSIPHTLFLNISSSVFKLPCRLRHCSVPSGLVKVRSRSNTFWHILIEKTWCFASQISGQQEQQPSHHHPSHLSLVPGWPPARINEHFLLFSSKR